MGIARSAWRKCSVVRPQLTFILGGALVGTLALIGCSDDEGSPLGVGSGGSAGGGGTGGSATGGGGSGTSGSATGGGGSGTSGSATGGGSGGATTGGGGSAGAGGSTAGGGNGGSAGSDAVVCPSDAGAGGAGEDVPDPTGDADVDGVPNCLDGCPQDVSKSEPGECGCGVSDLDTDNDGTFDCTDECPADAMKVEPGECGCGASDTANADNDAAVDCKDACPRDPALTQAGACGCLPESLGALCLAHRYQFDGTGTVVTDSIAAAGNGTVVGATLAGDGTVVLSGGTSDQYVELPARLISGLGNSATIEAWITWAGTGGEWQRIFDFGTSDAGAGMQGQGRGYLFLTPRAGNGGQLRTAISPFNYSEEDVVSASAALPTTLAHVAVVVDGATKTLTLYRDGASQGTPATIRPTTALALLDDSNNWLGRSQYQSDEELAATYHEFRVYSRALTAAEIAASFTAGADALP